MLRLEHFRQKLTRPLPTTDAGVLRTVSDARLVLTVKRREIRPRWQHVVTISSPGVMDGENDLREQILQVEADLEELTDAVDRCRKIILISKAIIAAGATLILAIALGGVGFDPAVLIGSIAAVIGGTVVFGSNTSTLKHGSSPICPGTQSVSRGPPKSPPVRSPPVTPPVPADRRTGSSSRTRTRRR
jgi:hypothetical protein